MLARKITFILVVWTCAPVYSAQEESPESKLQGPVTEFIKSAENRQFEFAQMPGKKVGFLQWNGSDPTKAPLVVVPGRGEVAYQWAETAYDLMQMGFEGRIYVWDPPGQGLSDRLVADHPDIGHIENFSDYAQSLVDFLKFVRAETGHVPEAVIAHSMGGTIAILAAEQGPGLMKRLALVAPMLDIRFGPPLMDKILTVAINVLGRFPWLRDLTVKAFEKLNLSRAAQVSSIGRRLQFREQLQKRFKAELPKTTLHWVAEANHGISQALEHAGEVDVPVMLFVAGHDTMVEAKANAEFQQHCAGRCSIETIRHATHALHEERNEIRGRFIKRLGQWLGLRGSEDSSICERLLLSRKSEPSP